MEINVNLTVKEIISAICEKHENDSDTLVAIINGSTTHWENLEEVAKKLIELLQENDALRDSFFDSFNDAKPPKA